jgi:hypothetical protein
LPPDQEPGLALSASHEHLLDLVRLLVHGRVAGHLADLAKPVEHAGHRQRGRLEWQKRGSYMD